MDILIAHGLYLHWVSLLFIIFVFIVCILQGWNLLINPKEQQRTWQFILVVLVLLRDIVEGLFQNTSAEIAISIPVQRFLGYGFGYLAAAFFPIYWYKTIGLKPLRWHAKYGPFILWIPVILVYIFIFPLSGDLRLSRSCAYVVPLCYGTYLIVHIWRTIFKAFFETANKRVLQQRLLLLFTVVPWLLSPIIGLNHPQWVEDIVINTIFVLINCLFLWQIGIKTKKRTEVDKKFLKARNFYYSLDFKPISTPIHPTYITSNRNTSAFEFNCERLDFDKLEIKIARLMIDKMPRKEIAEMLTISSKKLETSISSIYKKTNIGDEFGIKRQSKLIQILNSPIHKNELLWVLGAN